MVEVCLVYMVGAVSPHSGLSPVKCSSWYDVCWVIVTPFSFILASPRSSSPSRRTKGVGYLSFFYRDVTVKTCSVLLVNIGF